MLKDKNGKGIDSEIQLLCEWVGYSQTAITEILEFFDSWGEDLVFHREELEEIFREIPGISLEEFVHSPEYEDYRYESLHEMEEDGYEIRELPNGNLLIVDMDTFDEWKREAAN